MILVIGELLYDELPDGRRPGGAPFNFARHMHRLGHDVRLVSRIGNDQNGDDLLQAVQQTGLDDQYIQRDPQYATGRVTVELDAHGIPEYHIEEDVAYDHLLLDALPPASEGDLIYFGSLVQRTKAGRKQLEQFLVRQPDHALRFYDVNFRAGCMQSEILAHSLKQADSVKLNKEELELVAPLTGSRLKGDSLVRHLIDKFKIEQITITFGKQGSILYTGSEKYTQPAGIISDEQIVDTVGAGDAFSAIIANGILTQTEPLTLLAQATLFAEKICTISGAVPADNTFYLELDRTKPAEKLRKTETLQV